MSTGTRSFFQSSASRNSGRVKAVLFDLDGTLLDTLTDLAECYNRVLVSEGYPAHPTDAYRFFIGDGATKCVERALPEHARRKTTIKRIVELVSRDYANNWHKATREYEGITPLLQELAKQQLRISVLSNKDQQFTELCIRHFFPSIKFDVIRGYMPGVPLKPDPGGALKVAAKTGLKPQEIMLVGDTAMDMMTASAADMLGIGVLWGFRDRTELLDAGASALLETPGQLLYLITGRVLPG